MICQSLLSDTRLYEALLKFDGDLAQEVRNRRCPRCGGALHSARYPRKPRGSAVPLPAAYSKRESLCCVAEDCRRRVTPPSVRFLGRKVYLGVVITIVSAMKHGVSGARAKAIAQAVGASRETLMRWRQWWTSWFVKTPFWSAAQSSVVPQVVTTELPASLLARFAGDDTRAKLTKFLAFIAPITTTGGVP